VKKIYLLATVVAIITGFAVYLFASDLAANKQPATVQYEMDYVAAAAFDIPVNTVISENMIVLVQVPKDTIAAAAVRDKNYLIGKTTKYPISSGEQFFYYKVAEIGDNKNDRLSDRIRTGYRAYTLYTDDVLGLAGYLKVGDMVDIIVTIDVPVEEENSTSNETSAAVSEKTKKATYYFLQNIPVIAVGSASQYASGAKEPNSYTSITLEVPAGDCTMLNYNMSEGYIKIVLRGFGDEEIIDAAVYPG
jgi:pilus assembly protein CpaB